MEKFIKKHLIILSLIILIVFSLIIYVKHVRSIKQLEKVPINYYNNYCLNLPSNYEPQCTYYKDNICLKYKDNCEYLKENINNKKKITFDTVSIYEDTTSFSDFYIVNFMAFILFLISSLYFVYELFKSKVIINIIQRKGYKRTMKQNISKCYRYIWFIPLISIVILLLSFLASGHFDYHYVQRTSGFIYFDYSMNFIIYYILILLYMVLISIFFINIGLIVLRKNHNLIVVLFEAFLIYIGIDIFTEALIGHWLCFKINGYVNTFNILKVFQFMSIDELKYYIIYMFLLALITFIIVILKYKNKEKFIIDCEKN